MINGLFELLAGVFCFLNCLQVKKDKAVAGVNLIAVAFFTVWGWWNFYYYPHLGQWLSLLGSVGIVTANTYWVFLLYKYRNGDPNAEPTSN
jgi:hypothetical protein